MTALLLKSFSNELTKIAAEDLFKKHEKDVRSLFKKGWEPDTPAKKEEAARHASWYERHPEATAEFRRKNKGF